MQFHSIPNLIRKIQFQIHLIMKERLMVLILGKYIFKYISFAISHDDGFILEKWGGPLKPDYESIIYYSDNRSREFYLMEVNYTETKSKQFDEDDLQKWDYKDVIKFHEIRLGKNKMTKINVKCKGWLKKIAFVSNLWEWRDESYTKNSQDYVGPKEEESEMLNKITDFYANKDKDIKITIQEVQDRDMSMYDQRDDCEEEDDF